MTKVELEALDNELEEVSGGMSLEELRANTLDWLNRFFILPQATIDYINTTTNQQALNALLLKILEAAGSASFGGIKTVFEVECRKYGIPYEGYTFLYDF